MTTSSRSAPRPAGGTPALALTAIALAVTALASCASPAPRGASSHVTTGPSTRPPAGTDVHATSATAAAEDAALATHEAAPASGADRSDRAATASGAGRADRAPTADGAATRRELTLEAALATAREHHPRLASARAAAESAAARLEGAGRFPNPDALLASESAPLDGGDFSGDAEYLLGLSQPIPLGNRLEAARDLAETETIRAAVAIDATARTVERDVRGAFATALYAQEAVRLRSELLDLSRRSRELAEARLDAGDAVPAEIATLGLVELEDQAELHHVESLRQRALRGLALAVGDEAEVLSVRGDLAAASDLPTLEALLTSLAGQPELLLTRLDEQTAEARLALEQARRVPDIRFELLYRRVPSEGDDALDLGLSLPVRLFDDGRPRVRASRADVARIEALARERRLQFEAQARDAHGRARVALEHWRQLRDDALPHAERLHALAVARHRAGDATLAELLQARRLLLEAELHALETLHDLLAAWADLSAYL